MSRRDSLASREGAVFQAGESGEESRGSEEQRECEATRKGEKGGRHRLHRALSWPDPIAKCLEQGGAREKNVN